MHSSLTPGNHGLLPLGLFANAKIPNCALSISKRAHPTGPSLANAMPPRGLSPRVAILARGFVTSFVLPISLVWFSSRVLGVLGYQVQTWLLILLQVASLPAFTAVLLWYRLWSIDRRAARSGGVLPPRYVGHGIGDLGTLNEFLEIHWKIGYLGTSFEDIIFFMI